jgi:hypothetical protein
MTLWKCLGRLAPFCAGLFRREHPFDAGAGSISLPFPSGDFATQSLGVVDPASEALAAQDADLDLNHVEPACVLWGVVELDPPQDGWKSTKSIRRPRESKICNSGLCRFALSASA